MDLTVVRSVVVLMILAGPRRLPASSGGMHDYYH